MFVIILLVGFLKIYFEDEIKHRIFIEKNRLKNKFSLQTKTKIEGEDEFNNRNNEERFLR